MASAGLWDDDGCIHATSRKALKTRRLQKQTSSMHAIPSRRSNGVVLRELQLWQLLIPRARILRGRGIFHCPRNPIERNSRGVGLDPIRATRFVIPGFEFVDGDRMVC